MEKTTGRLDPETLELYESVLKTMTYKANWEFSFKVYFDGLMLEVLYMAPNSRDPSGTIVQICSPEKVPPFDMDVETFRGWLRAVLHKIERHESDEFLRFDGKVYREPHDERRT